MNETLDLPFPPPPAPAGVNPNAWWELHYYGAYVCDIWGEMTLAQKIAWCVEWEYAAYWRQDEDDEECEECDEDGATDVPFRHRKT